MSCNVNSTVCMYVFVVYVIFMVMIDVMYVLLLVVIGPDFMALTTTACEAHENILCDDVFLCGATIL